MPSYQICGLTIVSDLELPGVFPCEATPPEDICIRRGSVPVALEQPRQAGPVWALDGDCFLLKVPRVARILIRAGREMLVEMEAGIPEADAVPFLLGTAFSILLYQRRQMALHAFALGAEGQAFLFCGESGMGKSTLGAALCQTGCTFLNDDLCVLGEDDGRLVVRPDGRQIKLWEDSLDHLGLQARRKLPVRASLRKYYVDPPVPETAGGALPLRGIYVLRKLGPGLTTGITPMTLPESARVLSAQVYRKRLVEVMNLQRECFTFTAALTAQAPVFWLTQARGLCHLMDTVGLLRDHWRESF